MSPGLSTSSSAWPAAATEPSPGLRLRMFSPVTESDASSSDLVRVPIQDVDVALLTAGGLLGGAATSQTYLRGPGVTHGWSVAHADTLADPAVAS